MVTGEEGRLDRSQLRAVNTLESAIESILDGDSVGAKALILSALESLRASAIRRTTVKKVAAKKAPKKAAKKSPAIRRTTVKKAARKKAAAKK